MSGTWIKLWMEVVDGDAVRVTPFAAGSVDVGHSYQLEGWNRARLERFAAIAGEDDAEDERTALRQALLPDGPWAWVMRKLDERRGPVLIQLRLDQDAPWLEAIPWEAAGALAKRKDVVVVREILGGPEGLPLAASDLKTMLVLHTADKPSARAAERLKRWLDRDGQLAATLVEVSAHTRGNLSGLLSARHPDVLHYIGHGRVNAGTAELLLDGDADDWLPVEALVRALPDPPWPGPRLVVLESCEGAAATPLGSAAGQLARGGVALVIGQLHPVQSDEARALSARFYRGLLDPHGRHPVFSAGQARASLEGVEAWASAVVYLRGELGPRAGPALNASAYPTGFLPLALKLQRLVNAQGLDMGAVRRALPPSDVAVGEGVLAQDGGQLALGIAQRLAWSRPVDRGGAVEARTLLRFAHALGAGGDWPALEAWLEEALTTLEPDEARRAQERGRWAAQVGPQPGVLLIRIEENEYGEDSVEVRAWTIAGGKMTPLPYPRNAPKELTEATLDKVLPKLVGFWVNAAASTLNLARSTVQFLVNVDSLLTRRFDRLRAGRVPLGKDYAVVVRFAEQEQAAMRQRVRARWTRQGDALTPVHPEDFDPTDPTQAPLLFDPEGLCMEAVQELVSDATNPPSTTGCVVIEGPPDPEDPESGALGAVLGACLQGVPVVVWSQQDAEEGPSPALVEFVSGLRAQDIPARARDLRARGDAPPFTILFADPDVDVPDDDGLSF
ncbi:MAG: CHAT domain-containing protein [Alphaproteobacteria bacterium]|nr:CHAT domain-containing protein [Alphaproteobacteria bacterium]